MRFDVHCSGCLQTVVISINRNITQCISSQILEDMPPSFFEPVGPDFIQTYSDLFMANWGEEWSGYSLAYLVYICVVSMYNFSHPKFKRSAHPELQVIVCTKNVVFVDLML